MYQEIVISLIRKITIDKEEDLDKTNRLHVTTVTKKVIWPEIAQNHNLNSSKNIWISHNSL